MERIEGTTAPKRQWVLCIGTSHHSRSTHFSVGGGSAVGDVNVGEWSFTDHMGRYAHAHPVKFYGDKPEDLWPGSSVNNYRDCAGPVGQVLRL